MEIPGFQSGQQFKAEANKKLDGFRTDWSKDFQSRIDGAMSEASKRARENAAKALNGYQQGAASAAPAGGYKLGATPNHYGWKGMKPEAQEWSRRVLGQFPGLRFSSGYRSPEANRRANGDPNSGHMRGWKADFSGDRNTLHAAAEWLKKQGARTLLHDAGSGYHLDVSFEGVPLGHAGPAQAQPNVAAGPARVTPVAARPGVNVVKPIVQWMAGERGWTGAEWDALNWILMKESGYKPWAANPTSSARGLFQKMTSLHGAVENTVEGQARWGMDYIAKRYGSPLKAKQFWERNGWY